jgi:hypothetical protein
VDLIGDSLKSPYETEWTSEKITARDLEEKYFEGGCLMGC